MTEDDTTIPRFPAEILVAALQLGPYPDARLGDQPIAYRDSEGRIWYQVHVGYHTVVYVTKNMASLDDEAAPIFEIEEDFNNLH